MVSRMSSRHPKSSHIHMLYKKVLEHDKQNLMEIQAEKDEDSSENAENFTHRVVSILD